MERIANADYYHARQSCYTCLDPHDGVDTSVQIEYEGVLFLCRNCIYTLATTAGFVMSDNQEELDTLKATLEAETARADQAEGRLKKIRNYDGKLDNLAKANEAKAAV